jgi:hypothetical protein
MGNVSFENEIEIREEMYECHGTLEQPEILHFVQDDTSFRMTF